MSGMLTELGFMLTSFVVSLPLWALAIGLWKFDPMGPGGNRLGFR